MASIFISYRREDSAGHAGRVCDHLSSIFGRDHIFMDVQDIGPGEDFTEAIEHKISDCDAVVVMIGPHWLSTLQSRGEGEDFVREEVAAALKRQIAVIPVMIGGATMPVPGFAG